MGCKGSQVRILSPRPESKTKPAFYAGFDFGSSGYNEFGVAYVNVCPGSTTSRFDRSVNAGQIVTVAPQPAQKKRRARESCRPDQNQKQSPHFMRVLILVPVGITNSASHTSTYAQVRQQVDLIEVLTPVKSSRLPHSRRKKSAVRGNPVAPTRIKNKARILCGF